MVGIATAFHLEEDARGGAGGDQLTGGGGDNILIAGHTAYDQNLLALETIMKEWLRTDLTFAQRLSLIQNGGDPNEPYLLNSSTVFADTLADTPLAAAAATGTSPTRSWTRSPTSRTAPITPNRFEARLVQQISGRVNILEKTLPSFCAKYALIFRDHRSAGQGCAHYEILRPAQADAAAADGVVRAGLSGDPACPSKGHHPPRY
jgi:hypothetical protein